MARHLLRDGIDAVLTGIYAAVRFEPTTEELEQVAARRSRDAELAEIAAAYPLPRMYMPRLTYAHTADGKVKVHKVFGSGDEMKLIPIATPFGVVARLRHADQANAYGLRCVVQDMNGEQRAVDFQRGSLQKMGATDIRATLFNAGLRTETDGDVVAVQALKAADPEREIIVLSQPGWHQIDGCPHSIFVAPDGTAIGAPDGIDIELASSVCIPANVAQAGTLEGWQRAVAAAVSTSDCLHWTLGVSAGFAGLLVSLAGFNSCGINLSGRSTSGKSTAQKLGVSVWSTPDIREKKGLFKSANSTVNAIEPAAQQATGTIFALDELSHLSGSDTGKLAYTFGGNTGKQRLNADATQKGGYTWATFGYLSSEMSLEAKVAFRRRCLACRDGGSHY